MRNSAILLCPTVQRILDVFARDLDYLTWTGELFILETQPLGTDYAAVWDENFDQIKAEYQILRDAEVPKAPPEETPAAGCTRCAELSGSALKHHVTAK